MCRDLADWSSPAGPPVRSGSRVSGGGDRHSQPGLIQDVRAGACVRHIQGRGRTLGEGANGGIFGCSTDLNATLWGISKPYGMSSCGGVGTPVLWANHARTHRSSLPGPGRQCGVERRGLREAPDPLIPQGVAGHVHYHQRGVGRQHPPQRAWGGPDGGRERATPPSSTTQPRAVKTVADLTKWVCRQVWVDRRRHALYRSAFTHTRGEGLLRLKKANGGHPDSCWTGCPSGEVRGGKGRGPGGPSGSPFGAEAVVGQVQGRDRCVAHGRHSARKPLALAQMRGQTDRTRVDD